MTLMRSGGTSCSRGRARRSARSSDAIRASPGSGRGGRGRAAPNWGARGRRAAARRRRRRGPPSCLRRRDLRPVKLGLDELLRRPLEVAHGHGPKHLAFVGDLGRDEPDAPRGLATLLSRAVRSHREVGVAAGLETLDVGRKHRARGLAYLRSPRDRKSLGRLARLAELQAGSADAGVAEVRRRKPELSPSPSRTAWRAARAILLHSRYQLHIASSRRASSSSVMALGAGRLGATRSSARTARAAAICFRPRRASRAARGPRRRPRRLRSSRDERSGDGDARSGERDALLSAPSTTISGRPEDARPARGRPRGRPAPPPVAPRPIP